MCLKGFARSLLYGGAAAYGRQHNGMRAVQPGIECILAVSHHIEVFSCDKDHKPTF